MADESLNELWQRVLDDWGSDKAHAGFIEYCRRTQRLAEAATRYRVEADAAGGAYRDAGHVEAAKKRLGAITVLAMAELQATQTDKATEVSSIVRSLARWGAVFLLVGALAFLILTLLSR